MFLHLLFAVWATCQVHGYTLTALNEGNIDQEPFERVLHPPFNCSDMTPSPTVPTSVELVKAADIKVIAAIGDSLTTAIAANGSLYLEFRQLSWSIGGYGTYPDVITLANIFKLFNPQILGPAPKMTLYGFPYTINDTGFNFAVTGHNTLNVTAQIRHMIDTFKSYPGLNFTEDWKLVTMLIGMNDICDYCKDKTLFSPDNFIHYMTTALEMMMNEFGPKGPQNERPALPETSRKKVPRTIVNVVQIMTMKSLREVQKPIPSCQLNKVFCSCLTVPTDGDPELNKLIEMNVEFQRRLETLLHSDRFFKEDFAVVLQPYLEHARPARDANGSIDLSFFADDCFHFTVKAHGEMAKGLWNNMFQPAGEKEKLDNFSEPIEPICPTKDHPYIYTRPLRTTTTTSSTTASIATTAAAGPPLTRHSMPMLTVLLLLSLVISINADDCM